MMRSQTTTPRVRYWCIMDTSSVDTVADAAEMVVFTAKDGRGGTGIGRQSLC